jgi:hypothetical protein
LVKTQQTITEMWAFGISYPVLFHLFVVKQPFVEMDYSGLYQ